MICMLEIVPIPFSVGVMRRITRVQHTRKEKKKNTTITVDYFKINVMELEARHLQKKYNLGSVDPFPCHSPLTDADRE